MTEQQPLNADEILDVVDENDQVVGQAPRGETYARRMRTRCAFVLARDAEGRIFVHRRTPQKLVFPSHYDMFVGGVVGTGESYDEAALREAEEELGVRGLPRPEHLFTFLYETPEHTWWSAVYQVRCTLPVAPQEAEIDWYAFLTEEELTRQLDVWPWTPDGLAAYRELLARREAGDL
ncbi:NUDIX domain-containing protein [Streptomyces kronopolitis]|uniref:NUDIX domain-containing protein n=1 Tax=Streptomyces kronopolitis TaxID=1612435 RepID=UPI003444A0C1